MNEEKTGLNYTRGRCEAHNKEGKQCVWGKGHTSPHDFKEDNAEGIQVVRIPTWRSKGGGDPTSH